MSKSRDSAADVASRTGPSSSPARGGRVFFSLAGRVLGEDCVPTSRPARGAGSWFKHGHSDPSIYSPQDLDSPGRENEGDVIVEAAQRMGLRFHVGALSGELNQPPSGGSGHENPPPLPSSEYQKTGGLLVAPLAAHKVKASTPAEVGATTSKAGFVGAGSKLKELVKTRLRRSRSLDTSTSGDESSTGGHDRRDEASSGVSPDVSSDFLHVMPVGRSGQDLYGAHRLQEQAAPMRATPSQSDSESTGIVMAAVASHAGQRKSQRAASRNLSEIESGVDDDGIRQHARVLEAGVASRFPSRRALRGVKSEGLSSEEIVAPAFALQRAEIMSTIRSASPSRNSPNSRGPSPRRARIGSGPALTRSTPALTGFSGELPRSKSDGSYWVEGAVGQGAIEQRSTGSAESESGHLVVEGFGPSGAGANFSSTRAASHIARAHLLGQGHKDLLMKSAMGRQSELPMSGSLSKLIESATSSPTGGCVLSGMAKAGGLSKEVEAVATSRKDARETTSYSSKREGSTRQRRPGADGQASHGSMSIEDFQKHAAAQLAAAILEGAEDEKQAAKAGTGGGNGPARGALGWGVKPYEGRRHSSYQPGEERKPSDERRRSGHVVGDIRRVSKDVTGEERRLSDDLPKEAKKHSGPLDEGLSKFMRMFSVERKPEEGKAQSQRRVEAKLAKKREEVLDEKRAGIAGENGKQKVKAVESVQDVGGQAGLKDLNAGQPVEEESLGLRLTLPQRKKGERISKEGGGICKMIAESPKMMLESPKKVGGSPKKIGGSPKVAGESPKKKVALTMKGVGSPKKKGGSPKKLSGSPCETTTDSPKDKGLLSPKAKSRETPKDVHGGILEEQSAEIPVRKDVDLAVEELSGYEVSGYELSGYVDGPKPRNEVAGSKDEKASKVTTKHLSTTAKMRRSLWRLTRSASEGSLHVGTKVGRQGGASVPSSESSDLKGEGERGAGGKLVVGVGGGRGGRSPRRVVSEGAAEDLTDSDLTDSQDSESKRTTMRRQQWEAKIRAHAVAEGVRMSGGFPGRSPPQVYYHRADEAEEAVFARAKLSGDELSGGSIGSPPVGGSLVRELDNNLMVGWSSGGVGLREWGSGSALPKAWGSDGRDSRVWSSGGAGEKSGRLSLGKKSLLGSGGKREHGLGAEESVSSVGTDATNETTDQDHMKHVEPRDLDAHGWSSGLSTSGSSAGGSVAPAAAVRRGGVPGPAVNGRGDADKSGGVANGYHEAVAETSSESVGWGSIWLHGGKKAGVQEHSEDRVGTQAGKGQDSIAAQMWPEKHLSGELKAADGVGAVHSMHAHEASAMSLSSEDSEASSSKLEVCVLEHSGGDLSVEGRGKELDDGGAEHVVSPSPSGDFWVLDDVATPAWQRLAGSIDVLERVHMAGGHMVANSDAKQPTACILEMELSTDGSEEGSFLQQATMPQLRPAREDGGGRSPDKEDVGHAGSEEDIDERRQSHSVSPSDEGQVCTAVLGAESSRGCMLGEREGADVSARSSSELEERDAGPAGKVEYGDMNGHALVERRDMEDDEAGMRSDLEDLMLLMEAEGRGGKADGRLGWDEWGEPSPVSTLDFREREEQGPSPLSQAVMRGIPEHTAKEILQPELLREAENDERGISARVRAEDDNDRLHPLDVATPAEEFFDALGQDDFGDAASQDDYLRDEPSGEYMSGELTVGELDNNNAEVDSSEIAPRSSSDEVAKSQASPPEGADLSSVVAMIMHEEWYEPGNAAEAEEEDDNMSLNDELCYVPEENLDLAYVRDVLLLSGLSAHRAGVSELSRWHKPGKPLDQRLFDSLERTWEKRGDAVDAYGERMPPYIPGVQNRRLLFEACNEALAVVLGGYIEEPWSGYIEGCALAPVLRPRPVGAELLREVCTEIQSWEVGPGQGLRGIVDAACRRALSQRKERWVEFVEDEAEVCFDIEAALINQILGEIASDFVQIERKRRARSLEKFPSNAVITV